MQAPAIFTSDSTRQFIQAMCARVNAQRACQRVSHQPGQAVKAQANISLLTALALLNG